jgi:hypothetical protein
MLAEHIPRRKHDADNRGHVHTVTGHCSCALIEVILAVRSTGTGRAGHVSSRAEEGMANRVPRAMLSTEALSLAPV